MAGIIAVWIVLTATFSIVLQGVRVQATTFDVTNQCPYTVWAAASPGGGAQLVQGQTWTINVPAGTTQGRIWGRTGCSFNRSGQGSCQTGDCSGLLDCQSFGSGPATLVEYALNQIQNLDFYDISLVDGFNVPLSMTPTSTGAKCKGRISCLSDINSVCPTELKVTDGCDSACAKFNSPEYCCDASSIGPCGPTAYSRFFKGQCPQAYSYALNDNSSTFTCTSGTNYKVVFCEQRNPIFALYLYINLNDEE